MAKATKLATDYKIVLELSGKEAEAMRAVFQYVGGDPSLSRRAHIDKVEGALKIAGVPSDASDLRGGRSIYFEDTKGKLSEWV